MKAGWYLALYREAGEAGGSFHGLDWPPRGGGGWSEEDWEEEEEEEVPGRALAVADRRAQGKVRRYCASNGLTRLGTLTYAGEGCHDPVVLRADIGRFFRGVRRGLGGERFPYLWVPELHPGGHGWHVHFAVGRYVRRSLIEGAWGRGFVHITLIQGLPVGSGVRGEARMTARYLSKYLGKDLGGAGGLNRYDVAQGFQPKPEVLSGVCDADVVAAAVQRMGEPPAYVWRSVNQEGWRGPSAVWLQWR